MAGDRLNRILVTGMAVAMIAAVAGCQKPPAKVTSAWPVANAERVTPKPPAPLVWPFTGEKAPNRAAMNRRPLSVKIENSVSARPQTALNNADVVYETISEGGITRFNCIFHSRVPARVGPVRSARLSDLWVVPQYDALFAFSGASSSVNSRIRKAKLPNLSQDSGVGGPYVRSSARSAPHNLYLNPEGAYAAARARKYRVTSRARPLQFERRSVEATEPVTEVTVPFSQANTSRWVYRNGSYARFTNGVAHVDEATGKQVTADNVVVLWAKYTPARRDKVGSPTFDINLGGKGRVSVFHNGKRLDGTWTAQRTAPPRFKDAQGRPIRLTAGRTWFQVIPLNGSISMR